MKSRCCRTCPRTLVVASAGALALAMMVMPPTPAMASAQDCPGVQSQSSEGQCAAADLVATANDADSVGSGQPDCNLNAGLQDGNSPFLSDGEPVDATGLERMCASPGNASIKVDQPVEMGGGFGESACPGGCEG